MIILVMTKTNEELIKELAQDGYLKTPAVIEVFRAVDRKDFLPPEVRDRAYDNTALPIGYSQTISQPLVVAFMLELLELKPGGKVLEIGTGSGWKTALITRLVGDNGAVFSIERVPELYNFAKENLKSYPAKLILGDGSLGYPEAAPYDKIIAAAAAEEIPPAWKEQLKIGGRIVAPVKDSIITLDKVAKDQFQERQYFGFAFVPLIINN